MTTFWCGPKLRYQRVSGPWGRSLSWCLVFYFEGSHVADLLLSVVFDGLSIFLLPWRWGVCVWGGASSLQTHTHTHTHTHTRDVLYDPRTGVLINLFNALQMDAVSLQFNLRIPFQNTHTRTHTCSRCTDSSSCRVWHGFLAVRSDFLLLQRKWSKFMSAAMFVVQLSTGAPCLQVGYRWTTSCVTSGDISQGDLETSSICVCFSWWQNCQFFT